MKKFFLSLARAGVYLALFLLTQVWASNAFMVSAMLGEAIAQKGWNPDAILSGAMDYLYGMIDVVMILTYVVLLVLLWCLLFAHDQKNVLGRAGLRTPHTAEMLWAAPVLGLLLYAMTMAAFMLIPESNPLMQDYIEQSNLLTVGAFPALEVIVSCVCAPFCEELVFRGLMYKNLKKGMPVWVALLIQAALFGWVHGQILWFFFTFVLGIVAGLMVDYFDSIWPAILVHVAFNASNYVPLTLDFTAGQTWIFLFACGLALSLVLLALALYRNNKLRRGSPLAAK